MFCSGSTPVTQFACRWCSPTVSGGCGPATPQPGKGLEDHCTVTSGGASFDDASWIQEDVARDEAGSQMPYPQLSYVRFFNLKVNSVAPGLRLLRPTWMSSDRGTFGPTRLSAGGGFSVVPVLPSPAGIRYQEIAFNFNYPAVAYTYALDRWNTHTRRNEITAASTRFAHVIAENAQAFSRYNWPSQVEPLVRRLIAATHRNEAVVQALATSLVSELAHEKVEYVSSAREITAAALKVKASLHLPLSNYSGPTVTSYIHSHPG